MSDEQRENSSDAGESQHQMGLMLQRRALYELERANAKPYRSPKRIVLVSFAVAVTMSLFFLFLDKSVKVAHHVIDIWTPVIFDTKKPEQASSSSSSTSSVSPVAPYMIRVEPAASSAQSSSQRSAP